MVSEIICTVLYLPEITAKNVAGMLLCCKWQHQAQCQILVDLDGPGAGWAGCRVALSIKLPLAAQYHRPHLLL